MNLIWKARRGFACALSLVLLSVAMNSALRMACEGCAPISDWVKANSYLAEGVVMVSRDSLWLLIAYLCSPLVSLNLFLRDSGLTQRPTFAGWKLACVAILLGVVQLWAVSYGSVETGATARAYHQGGEAPWTFYVLHTVVLSPFIEEVVMRGFLYRAFRQHYPLVVSMILVLLVQGYFHWGLITQYRVAIPFLLAGGISLCLIREYTGSTWNCVLFHAAYNATVIRQWPLCIVGMGLVFFLLERTTGLKHSMGGSGDRGENEQSQRESERVRETIDNLRR